MNMNEYKSLGLKKVASVSKKLQRRVDKLTQIQSKYELRLQKTQQGRLVSGLAVCGLFVAIAIDKEASWLLTPTLIAMGIFAVFVLRHSRIQRFRRSLKAYQSFLQRQLLRCLGKAPGGEWESFVKYSKEIGLPQDLGLLGSQSLFTLMDENLSDQGRMRLLRAFGEVQSVEQVHEQQQLIDKLSYFYWKYLRLKLRVDQGELQASGDHLKNFVRTSFVSEKFKTLLGWNLGIWTLCAGLYFLRSLNVVAVPSFVFAIFPFLSLYSINTVHQVFLSGVGLQNYLGVLVPIFEVIQKAANDDKKFNEKFGTIATVRPAQQAKRLERYLSMLSTQTNPILHFLLNLFFPWTMIAVALVERSRKDLEKDIAVCLEELAEFELLGSLLVFAKYQTNTYPVLQDNQGLHFESLYHPLIDREKVVPNSFDLSGEKCLGLLTGSNMSGKSTFLRTVGLNQILANMGAPVFADKFLTAPRHVLTCIEVSDSLRDGYSYFYAEVKKLKAIIDEVSTRQPCLYLIDEIFRGTNNKERQLGSKAVIETLSEVPQSVGFISTHDLELTQLGEEKTELQNLHFREEITKDGEMVFYYKLQLGPSQTTNALRIMKAEGLRV